MKKLFEFTIVFLLFTSCDKDMHVVEKYDIEQKLELGTCKQVKLSSHFTNVTDSTFHFKSDDGTLIKVFKSPDDAGVIISITDSKYENFNYQFWGINQSDSLNTGVHENLNGKHLKDVLSAGNRTVLTPDGTKITMVFNSVKNEINAISIYSNNQFYHINMKCFKIEYVGTSNKAVVEHEENELDGETSSYEITESGLILFNIYDETVKGVKDEVRVDLGSLENDSPSVVNDLFDDPNLDHT